MVTIGAGTSRVRRQFERQRQLDPPAPARFAGDSRASVAVAARAAAARTLASPTPPPPAAAGPVARVLDHDRQLPTRAR